MASLTDLFIPFSSRHSQVYKISFWMRSFNAASMKRTQVITNNKTFVRLFTEAVAPQREDCVPTTKRYVDKDGKTRFCGTSALKESQNLDDKAVMF